jgi:hypothetical protein
MQPLPEVKRLPAEERGVAVEQMNRKMVVIAVIHKVPHRVWRNKISLFITPGSFCGPGD